MLIRRLIARYIDNILILVASIIIAVIANPIGKSTGNKDLVTITLILSFIIFYTIDYVILTKRSGQSIGKKILRLKLINQNKKDLSYLKVFFRELFLQVLSVTGGLAVILLLIPYLGDEKKLLHDSIFKTDVVKRH